MLLTLASCHHAETPVPPGPRLAAEPEVSVGSMDDECKGLTTALATFGECPNLEPEEKTWAHAVIEAAEQSFEAGKKAAPDEAGQHAIAVACHRATASIAAATERCHAGPRPKGDYK